MNFTQLYWKMPSSKKFTKVPDKILIACRWQQYFSAWKLMRKFNRPCLIVCSKSAVRLTFQHFYDIDNTIGVVFFKGVNSKPFANTLATFASARGWQVRFHG